MIGEPRIGELYFLCCELVSEICEAQQEGKISGWLNLTNLENTSQIHMEAKVTDNSGSKGSNENDLIKHNDFGYASGVPQLGTSITQICLPCKAKKSTISPIAKRAH